MLALATSVLAFNGAPAVAPQRSAVSMAVYSWSQPGQGATFDPLNLATTQERFERLRYVEVKHGRIAMLACLGHITAAAGVRFPGELSQGVKFSSITGSGFEAFGQCSIGDYTLMLLTCGFLEINVMKEVVKGEFPGDLRNGEARRQSPLAPPRRSRPPPRAARFRSHLSPVRSFGMFARVVRCAGLFKEGWDGLSAMDRERKINIELNNGRAAMMGILGLMVSPSPSRHCSSKLAPHRPPIPGSPSPPPRCARSTSAWTATRTSSTRSSACPARRHPVGSRQRLSTAGGRRSLLTFLCVAGCAVAGCWLLVAGCWLRRQRGVAMRPLWGGRRPRGRRS